MSEDSLPSLFGDDSDMDPDFNPHNEDSGDSSEDGRVREGGTQEVEEDERAHETVEEEPPPKRTKHPGRKRTRRTETWKRTKSSSLRNLGQEYIDRKGILHQKKQVTPYNHQCRYKCNEKVNEEKRQEYFDQFWGLGNWELQSSFLNSAVNIGDPTRKKDNAARGKSFSCQYHLGNVRVCKEFFLKTLDVSNKRVTNVATKKKMSQTGISPRDKRGRKIPSNKTAQAKTDLVKEHIAMFPKYTSHYSRQQAPNRKYLDSNLNIKKLYECYKLFCAERGMEPTTLSYYRHIFNTCFNLAFHRPHVDTCNTCDKLQNTIEHGNEEAKQAAITAKEVHLRQAESAKSEMENAKKEVKDDPTHVAICFDLQKMLPTPILTCTRIYYSRQLWTYNFNVHDIGTDNAFMFMWHEAQASRGCEEIVSCVLQYIKSLPPTVTHLTAFSDNCGGQNKSHITVKFWAYVVNTSNLKTIDLKFLRTGHSYNDCDRDFGKVEIMKKNMKRGVFVPDDWVEIIAGASKKFMVKKMSDEDFVSLDTIYKYFVKSVTGISKMQWLQFRKDNPWTLFYKNTFNKDMPFSEYSLLAKNPGRIPTQLPSLAQKTNKKKIKASKFKDLLNLLQFVPPIHHRFYRSLDYEGNPLTRQGQPREQTCDEQHEEDNVELENVYDSDSD